MPRNYGLPYMGSKNRLAERIVSLLPRRTHLIDLFCGGCAVSHAALLRGAFCHIHINDLDWRAPTLFTDALCGRYADERRWISREDFFRLCEEDPCVAICWSFANNMNDYIYSREIEPLKRAMHHAVCYGDCAPAADLGIDLSPACRMPTEEERYYAMRRIFKTIFEEEEKAGGNGKKWDSARSRWHLQSLDAVRRLRRMDEWQDDGGDGSLGKHVDGGGMTFGGNRTLTMSVGDYASVEIPTDSVIYCDIPYEGTHEYRANKADGFGFDYGRFYDWASAQREPVFISSYSLPPDRFDCIAEMKHHSNMCATQSYVVTERLFVPKGQQERGRQAREPELF